MAFVSDVISSPMSGFNHIDALLDDGPGWNWLTPARNEIRYSFSVASGIEVGVDEIGAVSAFNAAQQSACLTLLGYVSQLTGIVFTQAASGDLADIQFAQTDIADEGSSGLCRWETPYSFDANNIITRYRAKAYVYLDNVEWAVQNGNPTSGSLGYETLLHELGHALGLKHAFSGSHVLPAEQDNTAYTLMSYTASGGPYATFRPYDIAALMWIYGGDGLGGALGVSTNGQYLVGTSDANTINGANGNDMLQGLEGNDTLNGGAGNDTAVYSGRQFEYVITQTAGGYSIANPAEGTDSLTGIEFAKFTDKTINLAQFIDPSPPTVTITDSVPGTVNRSTGKVTFSLAFSEVVSGLDYRDFTVTNGAILSVIGSGSAWTVDVVPTLGVANGTISFTLNAGAVSDSAGNLNTAATNSSQTIDTVAPVAPKLVTNAKFNFLVAPQVTLQTSKGTVVLELNPEVAPATVANMLAYTNSGFYDGTLFHRVIPNFMAQGGGFNTGLIYKTPTYDAIPLESNNGWSNLRGTIAMARTSVADSATTQFFINQVDNTFLNYASAAAPGYAVFGKVLSGMDVIDAIVKVPTTTKGQSQNVPISDIDITSARQTLAGLSLANEASFALSGLDLGGTWTYSLDAGITWAAGSGTSLLVPVGSYSAGAIQVRQTDAAGNASGSAGQYSGALVVQATSLTGTASSDTFRSAPGDESMDGAAGTDTVMYTTRLAAYVPVVTADAIVVSGPDGVDTLTRIERLQFQDANLAFDLEGSAGQTYRLYQAAFNRTPDLGGLGGWIAAMDSGTSAAQVATSFMASAEFLSLYGASTSDEQFVTLLYSNALHRAADAGGLAYWVHEITSKLQTRAEVLLGFSESTENKTATLPAIASGIVYANAIQAAGPAKGQSFTGTSGVDNLIGSVGNDSFSTGAGNDSINAGFGNDTITGGAGNDTINGGGGLDTAIYNGKRATYTTSNIGGVLTVVGGTDGSDTLSQVERLRFEDMTLAFDTTGNAGQTYRLYQAAFNRTPDKAGLSGWIKGVDQGLPMLTVAAEFIKSNEFKALYGTFPTDSDFVNLLYTNALHRAADAEGLSYWVNQLSSHSQSREQALLGFSESAENQAALIGVIQGGIELNLV